MKKEAGASWSFLVLVPNPRVVHNRAKIPSGSTWGIKGAQ
jgi:hypothetical protein